MLALADDAALARLLIATAAVIDFSIEGGKAMGERDDEADPQTKIRLTYIHSGPLHAAPWMWTLAFGHHEDRTPTHGYESTREAANASP